MKKQFIFLSLIIISITASAQVKETHLWPNGTPNTNGLVGEETQFDNGRVGNVSQPEMKDKVEPCPNSSNRVE